MTTYEGDSTDPSIPGVKGTNTAVGGSGVYGVNNTRTVVGGKVVGGPGVYGLSESADGVHGESNFLEGAGVAGINNVSGGVLPLGGGHGSVGVYGLSKSMAGVYGESQGQGFGGVVGVNNSGGPGVQGTSSSGIGVQGLSSSADAVQGTTKSSAHAGVSGINDSGSFGVWARGSPAGYFETTNGQTDALYATTNSPGHAGVSGVNDSGGYGVWARGSPAGYFVSTNPKTDALYATTNSPDHAGVSANNTSNGDGTLPSGFALWAKANATAIYGEGNPAGYFKGDVLVTGDVILVNASSGDIAEDFNVEDEQINLDPGTVLVINDQGKLSASNVEYDTRVAGVISGAGQLKPAVVLQRVSSPTPRSPIALLGTFFCKADATSGSIAAGDLLTTSGRRGYAMKVSDKSRALGAILGKALAPLGNGIGIIPVLVTLR